MYGEHMDRQTAAAIEVSLVMLDEAEANNVQNYPDLYRHVARYGTAYPTDQAKSFIISVVIGTVVTWVYGAEASGCSFDEAIPKLRSQCLDGLAGLMVDE